MARNRNDLQQADLFVQSDNVKLQEMCTIVVSPLISVKQLVEEQCFSKPSSALETCSVDISIQTVFG